MKIKHKFIFILFIFVTFQYNLIADAEDQESIEINAKIEIEKVSRNIINALRYGKFGLADAEWKKIQSEVYKSYAEYDYLNGSLLYSRMEWQEAKESLNRTLKKEPNHEAASFLLGMIYAQEDSWSEAKETWLETNQISPYNPFYHYNLGLAYYILKDYNNAITSLSKSLEYKANYNEAKLILAKTYLELNQVEKAKAELTAILEQDPKHMLASHLMGRVVYLLEKDPKKSLTYLKNPRALGWREKKVYARCYFEMRKWREAENLLRPIAYSPFADEYDQSFYLNLLLNLGFDERANDFFHFIQKQSQNESKIAEAYRMLLSSREGKDLLYHYFKLRY
ncbi:tetratricopeptide repeat protein [Leptospira ellinghausenii]|nr:tetratricopeptide repeat protein [Leptospira ellinghausenii]